MYISVNQLSKIFLLAFIVSTQIFSQNISVKISGTIDSAYIYKLEGEKKTVLNNINSQNGEFYFSLKGEKYGFYRFQFDPNHWFDFLHNGDNIKIESDYPKIVENIKITGSRSNSLFYEFRNHSINYKEKSKLLHFILLRYPKDDKYYMTTEETLTQLQNSYTQFVSMAADKNPNSFIFRYIKSSQLPVVPIAISAEKRLEYLKSHSLDNVDFDDAELINSDVFTNKSIEYLTYFRNPQLPKELLETEFMKAVDSLLNKAKVNQLVYQHITDYLIDGFKQYGFDKIIDYIIEKYVIEDDLCLDEETENSIQKRIDQSKLLSLGSKVPNILMPDIDGEVFDLFKLQSQKTLLIFYSSQCPHCQTLLPKLNELQKSKKNLIISALSLDTEQEEWLKFVKENNSHLININDTNGWDGKVASEYFIYATPTMFLLDNEKKIIGKPTTFLELKELI